MIENFVKNENYSCKTAATEFIPSLFLCIVNFIDLFLLDMSKDS